MFREEVRKNMIIKILKSCIFINGAGQKKIKNKIWKKKNKELRRTVVTHQRLKGANFKNRIYEKVSSQSFVRREGGKRGKQRNTWEKA